MGDFIPTRGSQIKRDAIKEFAVVNYEKPKKKSGRSISENEAETSERRNEDNRDKDVRRQQELEMKRVRYEVMKFAVSGFDKAEARKAKEALAISLGAKAPKNKGINYKELKEQRKEQKELERSKQHASGLEKSLIKHKNKNTRRKDGGILGVYGKVHKKPLNKSKK